MKGGRWPMWWRLPGISREKKREWLYKEDAGLDLQMEGRMFRGRRWRIWRHEEENSEGDTRDRNEWKLKIRKNVSSERWRTYLWMFSLKKNYLYNIKEKTLIGSYETDIFPCKIYPKSASLCVSLFTLFLYYMFSLLSLLLFHIIILSQFNLLSTDYINRCYPHRLLLLSIKNIK